jgi:hypothetical protein
MNNHFNNQFNNNNMGPGQGGNQQFMQNIRDTTPHNFIQKSDQNMYGQYSGQNQTNQQSGYQRPFQNYGVSSNDRPPVVSQGGCCCSIM